MAHGSLNSRFRAYGLTPAFLLFLVALIGLPFVLYEALRQHAANEAIRDARSLSAMISIVRSYYAANVSGRLLQSQGKATLSENYHQIEGGIPIPATLSIELGDAIRQRAVEGSFMFYFVSDAPFKRRIRPPLDEFQTEALRTFRRGEGLDEHWRLEADANGNQRMRLAIPVRMEKACVGCHNSHPDSTARNWKVGDVRGIQDVSVDLSLSGQAEDSLLLSLYLVFFVGSCLVALREYQRSNSGLQRLNDTMELTRAELLSSRQALQTKLDRLAARNEVLAQASFPIILCERSMADLPIHDVNAAFERETGYSASEVIGRSLRFLHGPDSDPKTVHSMQDFMQKNVAFELEMLCYRRDGSGFWSRVLGFPVQDAGDAHPHYAICLVKRDTKPDSDERAMP